MALNNINFTLGQGGLGQQAPGQDYISGYLIYSNIIPSGFTSGVAKLITSTNQAISYGISNTYADETRAVATFYASATGSSGDIININVLEPTVGGSTTQTISYTRKPSDTTTTLLAASLANTINASGTGYNATSAGATVSMVAQSGFGASLNTGTPLTITHTGTANAVVASQFTGGVASLQAIWYYQISEFFRMAPNASIYVVFYPTGDTTYANILDLMGQSKGSIRLLMTTAASTTTSAMLSDLDLIQAQCVTLQAGETPISVLYSNNLYATTDLSTLPNLRAKSDNYLSVVASQDCGGQGAFLSLTNGFAVTNIGACLGTCALAPVEEDIAWTKFNISNGIENEIVGFMNGQVWNSVNTGVYNQLNTYGYIFLRKFSNISGSYWNDSHTCINITSDYSYIELNRVIGKAQRAAYADLFPLLNGPVYFNSDGTIATITISTYEDALAPALKAMVNDGEISKYSITVDTTSNVQQTGILNIEVLIINVGTARNINVLLAYAKTI